MVYTTPKRVWGVEVVCTTRHIGVVDIAVALRSRRVEGRRTETILFRAKREREMGAVRAVLLSDIQHVLSLVRHQHGYLLSKTTAEDAEKVRTNMCVCVCTDVERVYN